MPMTDRRATLKLIAGVLASTTATVSRAAELTRFTAREKDANARLLLKGGVVVSLDPKLGNFAKGDVLIQGKKIVDIGRDLGTTGEVMDAAGMIVIPGFVDCHRHAWEGQLRRMIPDGDLAAYYALTHDFFALHYRPRDVYVGNLLTALGCLDAGITCIIDNSHNSRSPEHSDAAVSALFDAGIRAVHASGKPRTGNWSEQWPQDLTRLQKQFFSTDDQLVSLRMFCSVRFEPNEFEFARNLGLKITNEVNGTATSRLIEGFWARDLLGADNTYNHCTNITEGAWRCIRDSGGNVNVCPRSDTQYGIERGLPALQEALDHGLEPGLSIDNETSYGTDMFTEMRVAFHLQRALAFSRRAAADPRAPAPMGVEQLLKCATTYGARCAGLEHKIGTLTPGKEADVVLINSTDINLYPLHSAVGTVVNAADARNVDTVIVGGRVRKFRGQLVNVDVGAVRRMIDESMAHLIAKAGYKPDLFRT